MATRERRQLVRVGSHVVDIVEHAVRWAIAVAVLVAVWVGGTAGVGLTVRLAEAGGWGLVAAPLVALGTVVVGGVALGVGVGVTMPGYTDKADP